MSEFTYIRNTENMEGWYMIANVVYATRFASIIE